MDKRQAERERGNDEKAEDSVSKIFLSHFITISRSSGGSRRVGVRPKPAVLTALCCTYSETVIVFFLVLYPVIAASDNEIASGNRSLNRKQVDRVAAKAVVDRSVPSPSSATAIERGA